MIKHKVLDKDILSGATLSNMRKAIDLIISGEAAPNKAIENIMNGIDIADTKFVEIQNSLLSSKTNFSKVCEQLKGYGKGAYPIIIINLISPYFRFAVVESNDNELPITVQLIESIVESPHLYDLTIVKEDKQFDLLLNVFGGSMRNGNIFDNTTNSMRNWFYGIDKYSNIIENQYVGQGKTETLDKKIIDFKNALRGVQKNSYWFMTSIIPKVVGTDDIPSKIEYCKGVINETKSKLLVVIADDIKEVFPETLPIWYDSLSANSKTRIYQNGEEQFLLLCADGNLTNDLIIKMARYFTGMAIEDWEEQTPVQFYEKLQKIRYTIENTGAKQLENGYKIWLVDNNEHIEKTLDTAEQNENESAELLRKDVVSMLNDYGNSMSYTAKLATILDVVFAGVGG